MASTVCASAFTAAFTAASNASSNAASNAASPTAASTATTTATNTATTTAIHYRIDNIWNMLCSIIFIHKRLKQGGAGKTAMRYADAMTMKTARGVEGCYRIFIYLFDN